MAVNDNIKKDIYFKLKMKECIQVFIENGNTIEMDSALRLLWQLSFDDEILNDLNKSSQIKSILGNLALLNNNNTSTSCDHDSRIIKKSKGILWEIKRLYKKWFVNDEFNNTVIEEDVEGEEDEAIPAPALLNKNKDRNIMISYNSKSLEICLKIKSDLEKCNYNVWMDVDSIHGISTSAMAQAIEESSCIIICLTEKYKQSPNCRAEADYAFKLDKNIIPIKLQPNYKPDGW
jgi:hypothetical protein